MTYKILISDDVHASGVELLTKAGYEVDVRIGMSQDELADIIGLYEGWVVRSATKVTGELLARAAKLKVIGRAGSGIDNIDVPEATRRGVVVMNTPGVNAISTAEHTISMIMAAHRHIPQAVRSMKEGKWEKKKFQGREVAGRTIGVIGLGRIGSLVAQRAGQALKMNVLGCDPAMTIEAAAMLGVTLVSVHDAFRLSDVITTHTPLTRDTDGLIDDGAIAVMKNGVILINCARGGIINEEALLRGLESGKVAAAALDVFTTAPPNRLLIDHPNVISTPHLGASTREAQISVAVEVIEQMIDFLGHDVVRNAVNVPSVDSGTRLKIAPHLDLAKRLGQFLGNLEPDGITEVEIQCRGNITEHLKLIANAAVVGLLSGLEGGDLNFVNAPMIAEARGIRVSQTTLTNGATYGASIEIKAKLKKGAIISAQGALIPRIGYEPRIIGIGEFLTEAVPAGPMLIVRNRDVPGMIVAMTTPLARTGINIAQMNLSRDAIGGSAISIINLDTPAGDDTLDEIRGIEGILSVRQVILEPLASPL